MNRNFKLANTWLKVAIATFVILLALNQLYDMTNLVDWFDVDDWWWVYIVYAFNIVVETIIGCVRWAVDKIRNRKETKA